MFGRRRVVGGPELAEHCVEVDEGPVHDLLAGADFRGRDLGVGPVASLRGGFDGGKVHAVAVAVAEEQRVWHVGRALSRFEWLREEFARAADEGRVAVQENVLSSTGSEPPGVRPRNCGSARERRLRWNSTRPRAGS